MTGLVKANPTVIPTRRTLSRATRSSSNTNETLFVPKKCLIRSFFIHTVRIWNALANDIGLSVTISFSSFKVHLLSYYKQSLCKSYDPEDPRSFKSNCVPISMPKYKDVSGKIVEYCAINTTEWGIRRMFGQSRTMLSSPLSDCRKS